MLRRRHQLAERRRVVGLSQENLAERLGVDRSTIVRWERGETSPQPWQRPRLAGALNVSVQDIAGLLEGEAGRATVALEVADHKAEGRLKGEAREGSSDLIATGSGTVRILDVPHAAFVALDTAGSGQGRMLRLDQLLDVGEAGDDVNRRNMLAAGGVLALGVLAGSQNPVAGLGIAGTEGADPSVPARLGTDDIRQIEAVTRIFTELDNAHGGGLAHEAMYAQLRWSSQLTKSRCPSGLRPNLFEALGGLAAVVAFSVFDAGSHDDAQRAYRFALACAEESGSWHLRASVLSKMARQAMCMGDADAGLTYAEMATVRADRLTATERAMLHTVRARALAQLDPTMTQEIVRAVAAADKEFANSTPSNDPEWISFYDSAEHHGDLGHTLFSVSLAGQGRTTDATTRLSYAVNHHGEAYARSRVLSGLKLASLMMATGDPHEATAIGLPVVESAAGLRSWRISAGLRELRLHSQVHRSVPDAVDLCDQIGTVVRAA